MKHRYLRLLSALPLAGMLLWQPAASTLPVQAGMYAKMTALQKRVLSSVGTLALAGTLNPRTQPGVDAGASEESPTAGPTSYSGSNGQGGRPSNYFPSNSQGCPSGSSEEASGNNEGDGGNGHAKGNIKVNPDCQNLTDPDLQGRAQAQNETAIAADPNNPNHLVAFYNNYQRGDGGCIGAYSLDGGRTWGYSIIPHSFTRGGAFGAARQYWQAGGDPSVAWDTKGNAYMTCQVFERGPGTTPDKDASSAIYVYRSTKNAGASWNFPGHPVIETADPNGTNPVTGTGAPNGKPFQDKPYMTVDNHVGSPFQDRVYVAYTEFTASGTGIIYSSFSNDYGQTFSNRVAVVTTSNLCPVSVGDPGTCDFQSFANPFTGPDGAYYIVFSNFNNAVRGADNRNQVLLVRSTDGGQTFGPPVKVSDYYDLPDCFAYQHKD
ncbi:MAG: glycoside hydrolase, partial [Candidatus Dormibacteraeota bacterium]|nr:glycoside hydrolase [Candidatus Dormibacteraeota bacterium]